MITREEFKIMQLQMVDMNNEKLDMMAQIKTIKESLKQADIIKPQINEIKSIIDREQRIYDEKMAKIQSKVSALTNQLRSEDDPNRQKTMNEKRLMKMQNNLQELIGKTVRQDDTISELNEKLDEFKDKAEQMTNVINVYNEKIKYFAKLEKKIKSSGALMMKVSELESNLALLKYQRKKNGKRIISHNTSISTLSNENENLTKQLNNLDQTLHQLVSSISASQPSDEISKTDLDFLIEQLDSINNDIIQAEKELQSKENEKIQSISLKDTEKQKLLNQIQSLEDQSNELSQAIEQYGIEHAIMVNKKLSLIDQLNQSIHEKIKDITRSRNTSPYVLRLIETQEKQWVERQQLYESYSYVAKKHKHATDLVARKAAVLEELKTWIKSVPKIGSKDPLAELENAYNFASKENRENALNNAKLVSELESLEEENKQLKSNV